MNILKVYLTRWDVKIIINDTSRDVQPYQLKNLEYVHRWDRSPQYTRDEDIHKKNIFTAHKTIKQGG